MFLKCAANDPHISIDNWGPNEETIAAMREAELGLGDENALDQLYDMGEDDMFDAVSERFMRRNEEAYRTEVQTQLQAHTLKAMIA